MGRRGNGDETNADAAGAGGKRPRTGGPHIRPGILAEPLRHVVAPILKGPYRVRVEGAHHVPADGPAIISPNHLSFFDSPLVMALTPRPVLFLGKAEYMDRRRTRYLFPALGMLPIKRDAKRASMAALETAADLLAEGRLVGIYPEGTRSRDGALHRGHTGVAHLAMSTGAPIVPVGIVGSDVVQPIGAALPRPGRGPVLVRFGHPIHPHDYRSGGQRRRRKHLLDDVMASIAAMTGQQRSPDFASDEPPLVRGGSESVYLITRHQGTGASWREAAQRAVAEACRHYDDARVGEVHQLACTVTADGDIEFDVDLRLSTRFRGGAPHTDDDHTRP